MTRIDLARAADIGNGIPSGTSFPGSPTADDLFYRTDTNLIFFYDGTRWLSSTLYIEPIPVYPDGATQAYPGANLVPIKPHRAVIASDLYDLWVVDFRFTIRVNTTNNGSNYVTVTLENNPTGTSLGSANTSADSPDVITRKTVTVGASVGTSSQRAVLVALQKTGSPGAVDFFLPAWSYRLIGT